MNDSLKPLPIEGFNFRENEFTRDDRKYRVVDLIEASKDLPAFDLPLCGIDIGIMPWGEQTIKSFVYHSKRVELADLNYPIILDDTGYPCDGWHRIAKAILLGKTTIKAKRLIVMPDPIGG